MRIILCYFSERNTRHNKTKTKREPMKRAILSLIILLGLTCPTLAQSGLSVRANASIIQLFFEDKLGLYDPADPMAFWERFRCALGFKYQHDVVGHLDMFASADLLHKNAKRKLSKHMAKWEANEVLPASINIPVMLGLNYSIFEAKDQASLWIEAGAGLNFRQISTDHLAHTFTNGAPVLEESSHMGATPTWKAGLGVTVSRVSLELAYSVFGSRELSAQTFAENFFAKQHHTSMLYLSVGMLF